jgi:hypothetical protein
VCQFVLFILLKYLSAIEVEIEVVWVLIDAIVDQTQRLLCISCIFGCNCCEEMHGLLVVVSELIDYAVEQRAGFLVVVFGELAECGVVVVVWFLWMLFDPQFEESQGLPDFTLFV